MAGITEQIGSHYFSYVRKLNPTGMHDKFIEGYRWSPNCARLYILASVKNLKSSATIKLQSPLKLNYLNDFISQSYSCADKRNYNLS
jgi:hypothetical protein